MWDRKTLDQRIGGTLSLSVAMLCAVFIVLIFASFLMVTVWLSIQQHTLKFERTVSEVSVAAVRLFHAANKDQAPMHSHQRVGSYQARSKDAHHEEIVLALRDFTEKSGRVKNLFNISSVKPPWHDVTAYLIWYSGATKIPDGVRQIWKGNAVGPTISELLIELRKTCLYICETPNLTSEARDEALARLNEITVKHLQPQLGQLLTATVHWQAQNIRATRLTVALAFIMLVAAVMLIWRGLIARLLRKIEAAKRQLSRQNSDLERRVAERTESLSTALEIANDAAKSRSAFLANMSHEIRTPMNGVLGMAALLDATKLDDQQRLHVGTIMKSGTLLLRIIDDVLDMSGLAAGKLKISRSRAIVAEIVEDVVGLLKPMADSKGLTLEMHIGSAIRVPVLVDPHRVSQVLNNLIGNAVKFTDSGGVIVRLQEAVTAEGVDVTIAIQDTGVGIPEDQFERVFGEFERVRNGQVISGAGLGLAITRSLVHEMNGKITLESVVGQGSEFKVTLPLQRAELTAGAESQAAAG